MTTNEQDRRLAEIDRRLTEQYGDYAGFATEASPHLIESWGEKSADSPVGQQRGNGGYPVDRELHWKQEVPRPL